MVNVGKNIPFPWSIWDLGEDIFETFVSSIVAKQTLKGYGQVGQPKKSLSTPILLDGSEISRENPVEVGSWTPIIYHGF